MAKHEADMEDAESLETAEYSTEEYSDEEKQIPVEMLAEWRSPFMFGNVAFLGCAHNPNSFVGLVRWRSRKHSKPVTDNAYYMNTTAGTDRIHIENNHVVVVWHIPNVEAKHGTNVLLDLTEALEHTETPHKTLYHDSNIFVVQGEEDAKKKSGVYTVYVISVTYALFRVECMWSLEEKRVEFKGVVELYPGWAPKATNVTVPYAFSGGKMWFAGKDGEVARFDGKTECVLLPEKYEHKTVKHVAAEGSNIYLATEDKDIYRLDIEKNEDCFLTSVKKCFKGGAAERLIFRINGLVATGDVVFALIKYKKGTTYVLGWSVKDAKWKWCLSLSSLVKRGCRVAIRKIAGYPGLLLANSIYGYKILDTEIVCDKSANRKGFPDLVDANEMLIHDNVHKTEYVCTLEYNRLEKTFLSVYRAPEWYIGYLKIILDELPGNE